MATYTANYGLHQWEPTDSFLRTDFNEDLAKIDTGIKAAQTEAAAKSAVVTGQYSGNGRVDRAISLGFQPKAVLLEERMGTRGNVGQVRAGLALQGAPLATREGSAAATVTEDGFLVSYNDAVGLLTNTSGTTYHYLAVR